MLQSCHSILKKMARDYLTSRWSLDDLSIPQVEPKIPAAIDLTKIEMRTKGTWLSPGTQEHRESVLRNFVPDIEKMDAQKNYIDAQREYARKTVIEFAQRWMIAQNVEPNKRNLPIRVYFSDEPKSQLGS